MRRADKQRLDRLATTPDGVCRYCGRGPGGEAQPAEMTDEEVAEILILAADAAKYVVFVDTDADR